MTMSEKAWSIIVALVLTVGLPTAILASHGLAN